jgi:hypothetical protein
MDGALLGVGSLWQKIVVLSLFCNLLLSWDNQVQMILPILEFHWCARDRGSWDSSSCWKFDEQASSWIFRMRVVSYHLWRRNQWWKKGMFPTHRATNYVPELIEDLFVTTQTIAVINIEPPSPSYLSSFV